MGILTRQRNGEWVDAGDAELVRELREGKPTAGWLGDPNLELRIGVLKLPSGHTGRRYEVHRYCEDGVTRRIGSWRLDQRDAIVPELARLDMRSRNRTPTIEKIDQENKKKEDDASRQLRDTLGDMMEHAARLQHDRNNPRNWFGMADKRPRQSD